jgi:hypothetical protein
MTRDKRNRITKARKTWGWSIIDVGIKMVGKLD